MGDSPVVSGTRDVLQNLIMRALRSEARVREHSAKKLPTGFYAGRRTGFVCSAATLCNMLYGTDYEAAKRAIGAEVRAAGELLSIDMLNDPGTAGNLSIEIATKALAAQ